METLDFSKIEGFEWDDGNVNKNRLRHNVQLRECEEIFFNRPVIVFFDEKHSVNEQRYKVYGISSKGRELALAVTIRNNKIRVIMARDQSRKERAVIKRNNKK